MARSQHKKTTTALSVATQYVGFGGSNGINVGKAETVSFTVDHPASATTDYTVQVSNVTDDELLASESDWTDYSAITIPQKTSAGSFGVAVTKCAYRRVRLKAVTSVASGSVVVRTEVKGPS